MMLLQLELEWRRHADHNLFSLLAHWQVCIVSKEEYEKII